MSTYKFNVHTLSNYAGVFKREIFGFFSCSVLSSTLFHMQPIRSTVSEDAKIELRTGATVTLAIRRSNNSSYMTKFCFTELAKIYSPKRWPWSLNYNIKIYPCSHEKIICTKTTLLAVIGIG
jgi:hypothetical protein